jgi:hypothetical protein
MNNFSIVTADRMTHLKIVVVALFCATLVAGIGVSARITDSASDQVTVVKAPKPLTASAAQDRTIR